ncbi:Aorsin [Hyphodiscus hymeniophilus]|uniref:tripeptidyl-peptidase II n=1 Tax=Hyphodiscus hymeniophilus TaxID=353542 RepID=A0A9P7AVB5_9HELO|nr:Aorsin [Hyphodiscus hymeniophilus]
MLLSLLITSSILGIGFAAPNPAAHVVHEKRGTAANLLRRRVEPDALIPVRVGLKQSNLDSGYERLMEVSHPSSPNYGKHLSAEEVHSIFAPAEDAVNIVKDWLIQSGIDVESILDYENKGWLAVDMPAHQAERLLHTEYYESDHTDGRVRIGCDGYSLPAHVSQHVDFIKPGVKLSPPLRKRTVERRDAFHGRHGIPHMKPPHWPGWTLPPAAHGLPPDLQNCGVNITPVCLQALYDLPKPNLKVPGNSMGVFEDFDAFSQVDIDLFFAKFAPWVPQGTTPAVLSVDGGTAPVAVADARNGGESDIDIELAYALIYPQTVTVYQADDLPNSSGETGKNGFLNTFLDAIDGSYCDYTAFGITGDSPSIDAVYPDSLPGGFKGKLECGVYKLTPVVSISYGEAEDDLPKPYVERQCNEIMKLGLQGHSILVASGDYGVASFPGSDNNEFGCLSSATQNGTIYNPDYPSGCPYITAVGATRLYPDQTVKDAESAMQVNLTAFNIETGSGGTSPPLDFFASGGGFSNYFTPPAYQAAAVKGYLETHNDLPFYIANADASNVGANGGVYNRGGRGYPDVAANGAFLTTFNNATLLTFFGTSLASPIFGSVLTLINEELALVGKGPVGFVNPVLYEHPYVLNDITNGSNPNCGSEGFKASKGWDPITGLGTPNYPKMLELFKSL